MHSTRPWFHRTLSISISSLMLFGSGCVSQPYPRYGGPNLNTYLALAEVVGRSAAAYGAYRAMEESLEEFEDLASRRAPGFGWTPAGRDCRP